MNFTSSICVTCTRRLMSLIRKGAKGSEGKTDA
ncbi:UNVERIFIED_ORG: hypothetical protein BDU10_4785 [Burkholderia sp. CF145]|nr:hypothetical protein PMI06_002636 [Burkholderia sp. BT03]SKC67973.1 hypothetical protein SAMN06266956_1706 [Paraburkholderia hospita]